MLSSQRSEVRGQTQPALLATIYVDAGRFSFLIGRHRPNHSQNDRSRGKFTSRWRYFDSSSFAPSNNIPNLCFDIRITKGVKQWE